MNLNGKFAGIWQDKLIDGKTGQFFDNPVTVGVFI